ncbi:hypothetical protein [Thermomicrobium sp.]
MPRAFPAAAQRDGRSHPIDAERAWHDRPCLLVNFGGDFYAVLWEDALRELAARKWTVDRLREALCGERVAVTGVLATYRSGKRVDPQIEYQEPGRLVVLRPPQRGGNIVI